MSRPVRTAAVRLYDHLTRTSLVDGALHGPDAGLRLEYRVGRLVRSYLPGLLPETRHTYLQAQGYWILSCWLLADEGVPDAADAACAASEQVLRLQRPDGAWSYPQAAWRGRVATAEGTWASLGLLESHRRTGEAGHLAGALLWADYLRREVGFQDTPAGCAVNYFGGQPWAPVPNNSALAARFLAELGRVTADDAALDLARRLVQFLAWAQLPSGELPYVVASPDQPRAGRTHFQCFQYNAFQCLDLLRTAAAADDPTALAVAGRAAAFVRTGVTADGTVEVDCTHGRRRVVYHAAAAAAALGEATRQGLLPQDGAGDRAVHAVLARQRPDGSLPFSERDYGFLRDHRSYPRNLAMVLLHLLALSGAAAPHEDRTARGTR